MTRTPTGKTKINFYFDDRTLEGLRVIATHRGTTYSELIREACRLYVLNEGGKIIAEKTALKKLGAA